MFVLLFKENTLDIKGKTMKEYELMTIIKPNMDAEDVNKIVEKFEDSIKAFGGKVLSTDKIGRKKLSYDIQKFKDGFFVVYKLEIDEAKVAELKRQIKLNDNIIRFMLLIADKVA